MAEEYGPLQLLPGGLLGFFQLKNAGRNPQSLSSVMQPTLDLRDWYVNYNAIEHAIGQIALADNAIAFQAFSPTAITVPQQEAWFVSNYTIQSATLPGVDESTIACAYRVPLLGSVRIHVLSSSARQVGPDRTNSVFAQNFFLPPGSELGIYVNENNTATTISYNGYVRYVRLPI